MNPSLYSGRSSWTSRPLRDPRAPSIRAYSPQPMPSLSSKCFEPRAASDPLRCHGREFQCDLGGVHAGSLKQTRSGAHQNADPLQAGRRLCAVQISCGSQASGVTHSEDSRMRWFGSSSRYESRHHRRSHVRGSQPPGVDRRGSQHTSEACCARSGDPGHRRGLRNAGDHSPLRPFEAGGLALARALHAGRHGRALAR